jgi:glycosyltransferase involved in cell wall biosynthesis
MPTWNAATFVRQTLESLSAQTYGNLEILVSDDASTDGTADLCEEFAAYDSRFRIMRQQQRHGWLKNTNLLLREVTSDYCFFAYHDDLVQSSYVARLVEALEANPGAILAFTDIYWKDQVETYTQLDGVVDPFVRAKRIIRKKGQWWIPGSGLFRSDAASQVKGMRRHLAGEYKADWPWLLQLALLGDFVRVPEPLFRKIWREESLSSKWNSAPSPWKSTGALLSCAQEVHRSGLPTATKARLYAELAEFSFGELPHRRWCEALKRLVSTDR